MQATTVAAEGTAEAKFNLVTFSVHLSAVAQTVPSAKAKLSSKVDALHESLEALKKNLSLEFVKNSVRSWSQTQEKYEWDDKGRKQIHQGFEVTYTYYFDIDDLEQVNRVYDALTSLNDIRVQAPAFSLKNRDRLNKKALKEAWKKVGERFAMECSMLGLDAAAFEIASWETSYSDSQRSDRVSRNMKSMRAAGGSRPAGAAQSYSSTDINVIESADSPAEDPSIGFTVGLASVTVNLEVGYARKAQ